MKRWLVSAMCAAAMLVSACGADPDLILQNDTSAEEEIVSEEISQDTFAEEDEDASQERDSAEGLSGESVICVYICGAVNCPGVYELETGDRIYQLVELAGGLSEDAAGQSVNLAQTVEDGEMVYIPTAEEAAAEAASGSSAAEDGLSANASDEESGKLNINTATAAELTALNGIGEAKAAAIVAYREEHGSFQNIEEIMQVDGIAEATYNKIKDEITV